MQPEKDGVTQVQAVVAKDGRLVVTIEWPRQTRVLDRDEAVALSLLTLDAAAKLFPTATEFSDTISYARSQVFNLHRAPGVQ